MHESIETSARISRKPATLAACRTFKRLARGALAMAQYFVGVQWFGTVGWIPGRSGGR